MKHEQKIAKASTIIVFLALIRTIAEVIRQRYITSIKLISVDEILPYIYAALIAAIGLFIMTILSYYGKNKLIIMMAIVVITGLVLMKYQFQL